MSDWPYDDAPANEHLIGSEHERLAVTDESPDLVMPEPGPGSRIIAIGSAEETR